MNARRKLFFLSGKGGSPAFDLDTQAQIDRIEANGGVIESPDLLDADVKFIKSLGLYNNWKYAIDPMCGINERVDGADTFVPKIFDYSGSNADTANNTAIEQPKKSTLNWQTALDFDGVDDRLVNIDGISFPNGTQMFSVAVYSMDYSESASFSKLIDKHTPNDDSKDFGKSNDHIRIFNLLEINSAPYQNTQILASGTADVDGLHKGFINETLLTQETREGDSVGKRIGDIRIAASPRNAKGLLQKNWDFNIIPTQSQIDTIYSYLKNQKNIVY